MAQDADPREPPQTSSPESSPLSSPEMTRRKKSMVKNWGSSPGISYRKKVALPPRPAAPVTPEQSASGATAEQQEAPASSHLQEFASSEDLSFADFSAFGDGGEAEQSTSLSGFLEEGQQKSCMNTNRFRRRSKVTSVDVASVGNASDTMVSVSSSVQQQSTSTPAARHLSGRELHEKAKVFFNAGNYAAALPLFESILSAQIQRFSPLHASVGAAMHNVGVCRQRMGQHALAENLFQEAVSIRQQTLGTDHLEVAASLSKLGAAQTALRKFDEAFENLRTALAIARRTVGEQHKTVAQMLCHLGCLYFEAGELMSSQATFQDALDIYRAVWPTEKDRDACMTQLTDTLCNIGSIQNRRKRFAEAVESFTEALDLQRGIVRHDDARIISTLDNLGYSYSKQKDYGRALSCYRKLYRAQVSQSGTFNDACFEAFRKEILMFEKLKRFSEAIEETKEALSLQKSTLPRDSVIVSQTKELLADLKDRSKRGEV